MSCFLFIFDEHVERKDEYRMVKRACTRETEVRLDGWCEDGLGQQRNDGSGCMSMHERSERVESRGTYVTE